MRFKRLMLLRRTTLSWAVCITGIVAGGCQPANTPLPGTQGVDASGPLAQPAVLRTLSLNRPKGADFGDHEPAAEVRYVADRVVDSNDAKGLPFLIVDKTNAQVVAFDADGRFVQSSPVLLGSARGDDSAPGIGERRIADIRPEERTTPAGRFVAELGVNDQGEDILWVDYDNAVSMHRLRTVKASDNRAQRLASKTAVDNRISYGCINVHAAFYDGVVKRLFAPRDGIVYVLPETRSIETLFSKTTETPTR
jgi:hypothetical protein